MIKKSFLIPVVLSLMALLITGVPVLMFEERFLDQPWWPVPLAISFGLAAFAIVAEVCFAPVPDGYRVYAEQMRMDINYGAMFPVVLMRGMPDGTVAKVRFAEVKGELLIKDYSSGEVMMTKDGDGLVKLSSGNFMVTKLPKHFRVTWSSGAWTEDKRGQNEE